MANKCPNCNEAGAQAVADMAHCVYCGAMWNAASGDTIPAAPIFLGGPSGADAMTTSASLGASASGEEDLSTWTKAELQTSLDDQGIEYSTSATKADLIALFE